MSDYSIKVINSVIKGYSLSGKMLMHLEDKQALNRDLTTFSLIQQRIVQQNQQNNDFLIENLFLKNYGTLQTEKAVSRHLKSNFRRQRQVRFLKRFEGKTNYFWSLDQKTVGQIYGKDTMKQVFNTYHVNQRVTTKKKLANVFYDEFCKTNNAMNKFNYFDAINKVLNMSIYEFQANFGASIKKNIYYQVSRISDREVRYYQEMKMKTNIAKHLEYSLIRINFFDNFSLNDIPDKVIINMFDNIENRLLYILRFKDFIIVHRVSDNRIIKSMITRQNKEQIEEILQQCHDQDIYDIVLYSKQQYTNLSNIKIRYLNYGINGDSKEITLTYPQYLVSASLWRVKITNMNQCVNLVNLCSQDNVYKKEDIEQLRSIKRLYSSNDRYDNQGSCLMQDLFKNNIPEFVHVINSADNNVVRSMTLSTNIHNLRYFNVDQDNVGYVIKLDLSNEFPKNMRLYFAKTNKREFERLPGYNEYLKRLEQQLIHTMEVNFVDGDAFI